MKNDPPDYDPDKIDAERNSGMTFLMRTADNGKSLEHLESILKPPSIEGENIIPPDAGWKQDAADELERLRAAKIQKP